jgi:hypothetical protein
MCFRVPPTLHNTGMVLLKWAKIGTAQDECNHFSPRGGATNGCTRLHPSKYGLNRLPTSNSIIIHQKQKMPPGDPLYPQNLCNLNLQLEQPFQRRISSFIMRLLMPIASLPPGGREAEKGRFLGPEPPGGAENRCTRIPLSNPIGIHQKQKMPPGDPPTPISQPPDVRSVPKRLLLTSDPVGLLSQDFSHIDTWLV